MDNEELDLYNQSGGEKMFSKKYLSEDIKDIKLKKEENDIIKKYRKKIIIQRNLIEKLEKEIRELKR